MQGLGKESRTSSGYQSLFLFERRLNHPDVFVDGKLEIVGGGGGAHKKSKRILKKKKDILIEGSVQE